VLRCSRRGLDLSLGYDFACRGSRRASKGQRGKAAGEPGLKLVHGDLHLNACQRTTARNDAFRMFNLPAFGKP